MMRRCFYWRLAALLASSAAAGAQTPTPTPIPTRVAAAIVLDGVSVEERITIRARAAESTTASIAELDRDRIEGSQSTTAAELVREIAGVHLLESGSLAGTSHVLTRGGDANFTLVLLDGIPLNDATDVQGGAFDLSTLDLDAIADVDVLRGPHSHFFGSSAVAGAINLVTRGGTSAMEMRLRLDAGEDSLLHAGAAISGPIARARSAGDRADASSDVADETPAPDEENAGFFAGAQYDRERGAVGDDAYRQLAFHGAATVPLGATRAIRVTGRATDLEADDYPEGSGGPVFGSGELRHTDGKQRSLGLTWGLDTNHWFHRGSAGASHSLQDVQSPAIELSVPPSVEDRDYSRSQLSWIAERDFTTRGHRVSLGGQLDHERGETESTLLLPDFLGGEVAGDYRLSRTTPGAFAAATLDAGRAVIEGGARADDPEALEVEWSPRVGVSSALGRSFVIRGSWSRAFKLPSFFALASPPALGGNPELEPETSVGADAALEWASPDGRSRGGVAVFRNTYRNLIDFDFESFLHVNRSRVEADGVEINVRMRAHEALVVSAAWTFQDVDSPTGANVALHSPDQFGNLSFEWSPTEALQIRIAGRVAGDTEDIQIPVPDRTHVEGYEVLDLGASWRATEHIVLRARVDNVTDEEYEQFVGFRHPGRRGQIGVAYHLDHRSPAPVH